MDDATFDDIPYEAFTEYILPQLSIKEVGVLSMVNSCWKTMADEQEVWKILYLRTIRVDILDTSIHIGPKWNRRLKWGTDGSSTLCNSANLPLENSSLYTPISPLSVGRWCYDSYEFKYRSACTCCIPKDLKENLKSWREVRTDGVDTDEFPPTSTNDYQLHVVGWHRSCPRNTEEYQQYVKGEWEKYNAKRGLSTVSLCQNPTHYEFNTLGIPSACRNYKSFKKMTLKKHLTEIKHQSKKTRNAMMVKKRKFEKAKKIMEELESEFQQATEKNQGKMNSIEKMSLAIQSI